MRFDENAQLDTSNIDDLRGSGGGGAAGSAGGSRSGQSLARRRLWPLWRFSWPRF